MEVGIIRFLSFLLVGLILCSTGTVFAQNSGAEINMSRGSIPEELMRPRHGEAPRYPVDTVIGNLGRGEASDEAFSFARAVAVALTAGTMNASSLASMNTVMLESYLSALSAISPRSYRIGSGREEPDGSVSFLVRFIGREQGITGELFIRPGIVTEAAAAETEPGSAWVFDELILEEARSRENENEETKHRIDFSPYERFF